MQEGIDVSTNHFEVDFDDIVKTELLDILYAHPTGRSWDQLHTALKVWHKDSAWVDTMMNRVLPHLIDDGSVLRWASLWQYQLSASKWLIMTNASQRSA